MKQIAPANIPVLITGESGTGKELVAQAIHNNSKRSKRQFAPLNCAGLSESILEDELFGHVRGAFTGAEKERQGRFEYAHQGTLFLDEVGDMPRTMQAKLLRVLESGEVVRVGSNEPRHVDVRLISATNRDLAEMVKDREFREDLYFRVKGVELRLPALRERREDIPLLTRHFVARYAHQMEKDVPAIAEDVQMTLMGYDWPGNVRQLMNVIQNMVVIAEGDTLEPRHLPHEIAAATGLSMNASGNGSPGSGTSGPGGGGAGSGGGAGGGGGGGDVAGSAGEAGHPRHAAHDRRQPRTGRQNVGHRRTHPVPEAQGVRAQVMVEVRLRKFNADHPKPLLRLCEGADSVSSEPSAPSPSLRSGLSGF